MARHLNKEELAAGLPEILSSPKDKGPIESITAVSYTHLTLPTIYSV